MRKYNISNNTGMGNVHLVLTRNPFGPMQCSLTCYYSGHTFFQRVTERAKKSRLSSFVLHLMSPQYLQLILDIPFFFWATRGFNDRSLHRVVMISEKKLFYVNIVGSSETYT